MSPAASRRLASSTRCRSSAFTAISGSGSGAFEEGVFVCRRPSTRWTCDAMSASPPARSTSSQGAPTPGVGEGDRMLQAFRRGSGRDDSPWHGRAGLTYDLRRSGPRRSLPRRDLKLAATLLTGARTPRSRRYPPGGVSWRLHTNRPDQDLYRQRRVSRNTWHESVCVVANRNEVWS